MITRALFGRGGDIANDRAARALILAQGMLATATIVVSPLIADLAGVFAVSEAESGLLIGAFSGTLLLTFPFSGYIAERLGQRRTVVSGLTLFGLGGGAIAYVETFELALCLRVVQGIGFALSQPVLIAQFAELCAGLRETTVQGINSSVKSLFQLVTPAIAGLLFVVSWRTPFLLYFLTLPAAALIWATLPEYGAPGDRSGESYLRGMAAFLAERSTALLMSSFFVRTCMLFGMYTYISVLAVQEAGMTAVTVGVVLGVNSLFKLTTASQVGRLAGHRDTSLIALAGFALFGAGLALAGLVPTAPVLFLGIAAAGVGDGLIDPALKSLVNDLSPAVDRTSAMAAALTFQSIGKTVSPVAVGILLGVVEPAFAFFLLGSAGGAVGVTALLDVWVTRTSNPVAYRA